MHLKTTMQKSTRNWPKSAVLWRDQLASLYQSGLIIPEDWIDMDADTFHEFCSTMAASLARGGTTEKAARPQIL